MRTIKHVSCSIVGLLKTAGKRSLKGFMTDENGKDLSDKEVRQYLQECLDKGYRVLPIGECEGFDYQTGCPGHVCPDSEINTEEEQGK